MNTRHPLYSTWTSIIDRCCNPNHKRYADYGGRGIGICNEWRHSFQAFADYVSERPLKHSIDRVNNDLGYQPGNVRWATAKEQSRNRRGRRMWEWAGENLMLAEWGEVLEEHPEALRERINEYGDLYHRREEFYRFLIKASGRIEVWQRAPKKYLGVVSEATETAVFEMLRLK